MCKCCSPNTPKVDFSKPIVYSCSGKTYPARLVATDVKNSTFRQNLVLVTKRQNGYEEVIFADNDGQCSLGKIENKLEKRKVWVVTFRNIRTGSTNAVTFSSHPAYKVNDMADAWSQVVHIANFEI